MLFGLKIKQIKNLVLVATLATFTFACKTDPASKYSSFITPDGGSTFTAGKDIKVSIQFAKDKTIDSVVYFIDSTRVSSHKDTLAKAITTSALKLGNHLLTAKIYTDGTAEELVANFILLASNPPVNYTYKIVNKFPHDISAYTEGLGYYDGKFLESTGEKGKSELKWVNVNTGKTIQKTQLAPQYFGEGSVKIGDKIIMLTWQEQTGFVFDSNTLKKISEFSYTAGREGWGMTFDGERILTTEGSNSIIFLDKNTYKKTGSIEVYDDKGKIDNLNELEFIDGKIYANVYTKNYIIIINPKSGAVEGKIDMSGLLPADYFKTDDEIGNNVLNGIAYDKTTKRLFVTGKKWPSIFEIKLIQK